ncbi:hypothetical protein [Hymenobacter pini]|uniref:hypothetical protein n=1 Tax=Hymenobacter pini TaxID=2880879 RepID=UPI001CF2E6AC|nr:hypothetical protein [Hymenobacter pini]MCA8831486.1 hypothetical protein [Hymenobacter pini]
MSYPYWFEKGALVVMPGRKKVFTVLWRGLVPQPDGYSAAVYQLDDGHWDCYYQDELRTFGQPAF